MTEHIEAGLDVTRIGIGDRITPEIRDNARLWAHRRVIRELPNATKEEQAEALKELIGLLGLYVNEADIEAGFSYAPALVDGVEHTRHAQETPPLTKPKRRV